MLRVVVCFEDLTLMFVHGVNIEEAPACNLLAWHFCYSLFSAGYPERLHTILAVAPQDGHQNKQSASEAKQAQASSASAASVSSGQATVCLPVHPAVAGLASKSPECAESLTRR